jgi:hypothetical protein
LVDFSAVAGVIAVDGDPAVADVHPCCYWASMLMLLLASQLLLASLHHDVAA